VDRLSIIGITLALVAILGGQLWEGGELNALVNLPAMLIVVGGTLGATMLQMPVKVFHQAMRILPWVMVPPRLGYLETTDKLVSWSVSARRKGLLELEDALETERNPFVRKGLGLLIDGYEPFELRSILELDIEMEEERLYQASKVFDAMGGYAPTLGIVGAVLGLIQVMGNLADPSQLGPGIATAFVATIYGIALANLFCLPLGAKLRAVIDEQSKFNAMVIEGLIAIGDGTNPKVLESRLASFH
jgi:chemotaxis protein MotA|tara:strand:+ start:2561 stop:3298 length:738 start_codon:yes stop_codon:yes gene_type:complete